MTKEKVILRNNNIEHLKHIFQNLNFLQKNWARYEKQIALKTLQW